MLKKLKKLKKNKKNKNKKSFFFAFGIIKKKTSFQQTPKEREKKKITLF